MSGIIKERIKYFKNKRQQDSNKNQNDFMIKVHLLILLVLPFFFGCGPDKEVVIKEFNELETEVKDNYVRNFQTFRKLKACLTLKHIRVIEFKEEDKVTLEYQLSETSKWEKLTGDFEEIGIKNILIKEGLPLDYISNIKNLLDNINANCIWVMNDYDATTGMYFTVSEIRHKKIVNDLFFVYKIFDRPLDSIESAHYALPTQENKGGILDKDVIYFYQ